MRMAVILIKHMLTLWTMQFHMNSSGSHPSTFIEGMADKILTDNYLFFLMFKDKYSTNNIDFKCFYNS